MGNFLTAGEREKEKMGNLELFLSRARGVIIFPKKKRIYASRCFSVVMLVPMLPIKNTTPHTNFHSHSCLGRSSKNNCVRVSCWNIIFYENLFFAASWVEWRRKRKKCSGSAVNFVNFREQWIVITRTLSFEWFNKQRRQCICGIN